MKLWQKRKEAFGGMVSIWLSGMSTVKIEEKIRSEYGDTFKKYELDLLMQESYTAARTQARIPLTNIYVQNVERYSQRVDGILEEDYKQYFEKEHLFKQKAFFDLLVLMGERQKLCGFKVKRFKVILNERLNLRKVAETSEFRHDLMTFTEKLEFLQLLKKMKKGVIEIEAIKEGKSTIDEVEEIIVGDIDFVYDQIRIEQTNPDQHLQQGSTFEDIKDKILKGEELKLKELWKEQRLKNDSEDGKM